MPIAGVVERALSATRARQLLEMPQMKTLSTTATGRSSSTSVPGMHLATGCRRNVSDFHFYGDEATVRLHEKDYKRPTIGLH